MEKLIARDLKIFQNLKKKSSHAFWTESMSIRLPSPPRLCLPLVISCHTFLPHPIFPPQAWGSRTLRVNWLPFHSCFTPSSGPIAPHPDPPWLITSTIPTAPRHVLVYLLSALPTGSWAAGKQGLSSCAQPAAPTCAHVCSTDRWIHSCWTSISLRGWRKWLMGRTEKVRWYFLDQLPGVPDTTAQH